MYQSIETEQIVPQQEQNKSEFLNFFFFPIVVVVVEIINIQMFYFNSILLVYAIFCHLEK